MEPRVSDQASFILRRREWRNSSLILDIFTRDYGCIRALARGARRGSSQTPYQPFVMLSVNWSGRQELKTLTGIEGQVLPVAEENYLSLLYVNELIGAMLPPGEANAGVFSAYFSLLKHAVLKLDESRLRIFELELMRLLGYFPDVSADAVSGQAIDENLDYQFVINSGFVACTADARDSVSGRVIIDWHRGDYAGKSVLRLAKSVLRSTIDFNLHGKTLKSRNVYSEMMRRK
ncbi:MAG: DNA repair protein RecO [Gammaproteobacteria bacterium]|nr:DNA repair protein RecO [Gammaproteobacteria bacterium]